MQRANCEARSVAGVCVIFDEKCCSPRSHSLWSTQPSSPSQPALSHPPSLHTALARSIKLNSTALDNHTTAAMTGAEKSTSALPSTTDGDEVQYYPPPTSSYYFGPPDSSRAFGEPVTGKAGVHLPKEIVRYVLPPSPSPFPSLMLSVLEC